LELESNGVRKKNGYQDRKTWFVRRGRCVCVWLWVMRVSGGNPRTKWKQRCELFPMQAAAKEAAKEQQKGNEKS